MAPPPRPPANPTTIRRGEVYCDKDFWSRSAAWFVHQQEQLEAQQQQQEKQLQQQKEQQEQQKKTKPTKKTPRWASTTPTRVQPARAAKGKKRHADEDNEAVAPVQKKVKMMPTPESTPSPSPSPPPSPPPPAPVTLTSTVDTPCPDYMLDPTWATTSLSTFQAAMDTLLEGKRAIIARSSFWSTQKSMVPPPSASFSCVNRWCPIVALPLACTDMLYCSHGRSSLQSYRSVAAPAYMSPPPSPPADAMRFQARPFAELQHIQERAVSLAGLCLTVDMCNGMLRVYMV
ncbi:hypothetical protein Sste5346_009008 [Sporothrix stenoceras]|uniref:Uncharacterized protein n=1 Tax=Sporothrix stenoceras TaxID=5173 RepID=A0ABR3YLP2_9PEZI